MKIKRTCMAKTFYRHLRLDQRAGKCEPEYMGEEKTIFCPRCAVIVNYKRNNDGDIGIEHPDNPHNRPDGKPCAWYKCKRQAPPDHKYCCPTCQRSAKACRRSEQDKKDYAESKQVVVFRIPSYSSYTLQRLPPAKLAAAINDIAAGRANLSK